MKRVCLAVVFVLSLGVAGFGQTTFYYPQVANGLQGVVRWKTTIFLTNPSASGTASGSITLFQDTVDLSAAGSPFNSIVFKDETGAIVNNGNTIPFQIAVGQSRKYASTGDGSYAGGYAIVTANATISGT